MSPIALNGIDKQGIDVNGEQTKQSLSAAFETVNKGVYDATTLSTVDADLASANIADGVTVFGILGTAVASGSLAEDVEGNHVNTTYDMSTGPSTFWYYGTTISSGVSMSIANLTQSYSADSLAFAAAFSGIEYDGSSAPKFQLIMDGVTMQSTNVLSSPGNLCLHDFKAMSGSCLVYCRVNNDTGADIDLFAYGYNSSSWLPAAIACGSVVIT